MVMAAFAPMGNLVLQPYQVETMKKLRGLAEYPRFSPDHSGGSAWMGVGPDMVGF
jgi:hypothetical protein